MIDVVIPWRCRNSQNSTAVMKSSPIDKEKLVFIDTIVMSQVFFNKYNLQPLSVYLLFFQSVDPFSSYKKPHILTFNIKPGADSFKVKRFIKLTTFKSHVSQDVRPRSYIFTTLGSIWKRHRIKNELFLLLLTFLHNEYTENERRR